MWSRVTVKTPPTGLPVTEIEFRRRNRIETNEEGDLIGEILLAAVATIDGPNGIGFAMMRQTWTLTLDSFPATIRLPGGPIVSVDEIRYTDPDGAAQTLASNTYQASLKIEPPCIRPVVGAQWPAIQRDSHVEIDYSLGSPDMHLVPAPLRTAVRLIAGHLYEHREATTGERLEDLPFGVDRLIAPYRRHRVAQ